MSKFLVAASYTPEGLRGLAKDKGSGRKAAVEQALASVGGKLDAVYFALGEWDVFLICDCPDSVTAAAVGLTVSATGLVRTKTTALLTVEEVDKALSKMVSYRPPGA